MKWKIWLFGDNEKCAYLVFENECAFPRKRMLCSHERCPLKEGEILEQGMFDDFLREFGEVG